MPLSNVLRGLGWLFGHINLPPPQPGNREQSIIPPAVDPKRAEVERDNYEMSRGVVNRDEETDHGRAISVKIRLACDDHEQSVMFTYLRNLWGKELLLIVPSRHHFSLAYLGGDLTCWGTLSLKT